MKKIKIVTDSSCDLNKDIIEKYDIKVVPLNVSFGEDVYIDGQLDNKEFYDRMSKSKELPKTSCPSPEKFMKAYEGDEDVIVFNMSSKLSGTYSAALLAKNMILEEDSNKKNPMGFPIGFFYGAISQNRTGDLLITNQLLYQLSYNSIRTL